MRFANRRLFTCHRKHGARWGPGLEFSIRKRKRASGARKIFAPEDFKFLLQLPAFAIVSCLVPERGWQAVCRSMERLGSVSFAAQDSGVLQTLRSFGLAGDDDLRRVRATRHEHHIQIMRERLGGWNPAIALQGIEHLEAAQNAGHGAVLWIAHFSFNALAAKIAFARAGFEVFHVSRPEHGFTKSRFGIRFLNPIRIGAELRYAAGRVVIDRADPAASMNEARRLLRANKFVSITAGAWEGEVLVTARIGESGIEVASGAPRLARIAGAPLLPVFVGRDDSTGQLHVVVERPIDLARHRDKAEMIQGAAQEFADRHLPYLQSWPHQWRDWEKLTAFTPR
ncbi:hypothetical protein [Mesorhizobium sp. M4B.F.Ca.ET.013.02.1.1]|uniref:LpxL/LpxP family acyltransferase n=1 Tax=Mesorhizobium sp. M4B.F.Ca.ET.013.02.1.1 TaxID=2496755 RepID=UPI000FEBD153|nr:hypothetical protein [Mesorhizobium sp. M4B.F.Ca.ET.013.02.1.1]